ncbi:MAG TPA: amidohydrolase family protein, partial [Candidatus Binatia bacterium]|nr:amidohydrolase family protein [Candidatus Binatia bacterium]
MTLTIAGGVVEGLDNASPGAGVARVDLAGAHVVPGFVDAHSHLSVGAWVPWFADGAEWGSAARAIAEVRKAAGVRAGGWILAFNVDDDAWPDGAPTAADLEAAAPGH